MNTKKELLIAVFFIASKFLFLILLTYVEFLGAKLVVNLIKKYSGEITLETIAVMIAFYLIWYVQDIIIGGVKRSKNHSALMERLQEIETHKK